MNEMERDDPQLQNAIRSATPEFAPPPDLESRLLAATEALSARGNARRWRLRFAFAAAAVAVAAVVLYPRPPVVVLAVAKQPVTDWRGRSLKVGDKLPAGAVIRTGAGGRATLLTRQGSELTLNANSELKLARDGRGADLHRGEVYCRNRAHELARLVTAAGDIRLLGTALNAVVEKPEQVAVTVVDGQVQLANAHGQAVVPAGRRALLVASRAPEEGAPVDTRAETAWYSGKLDIVSDYGEIAYSFVRESGRVLEVWAMSADGSNKHLVKRYVGESFAAPGPWLAGEQRVFIATDSPFFHLSWNGAFYLLNTATGQDVVFSLPEQYHVWYSWLSPDGMQLAFTGRYYPDRAVSRNSQGGLWLYDLTSGRLTQITDDRVILLAWAPDSRYLVVSHGGAEGYPEEKELAVVDAATGEITDLNTAGYLPTFSPDAKKLAFIGDYHEDQDDHNLRKGRVLVLDLAPGSTPRPIGPGNESVRWIRWSPDGARVAYVAEDEHAANPDGGPVDITSHLVVADAGGAGAEEAYRADVWTRAISWNQSGDAIYMATADGRTPTGVLLVAADGSGVIADLGGNSKDSITSDAEQQQARAAYKVLKDVESLQKTASKQEHLGQVADSQASYRRVSRLLSGLTWDYPLAAFSHTSLLRFADAAEAQANRSPSAMLESACAQHLQELQHLVLHDAARGGFPSVARFVEQAQRPSQERPDFHFSADDAWYFNALYRCPSGDAAGKTVIYTYHPPAGPDPEIGHVLLSCPVHPRNKIVWDARRQEYLGRRRKDAPQQTYVTGVN